MQVSGDGGGIITVYAPKKIRATYDVEFYISYPFNYHTSKNKELKLISDAISPTLTS